jgi:PAS domain-containing protein
MTEVLAAEPLNRRHFQQIMAGLTEGVLFIETDRRIVWANEAALRMHGADNTEALGGTVEDYGRRFTLRYRNGQLLAPEAHPLQRLCAGEAFNELIVETRRADDPEADWVHTLRGFTLVDASGEPDLHVLVLADHTERFEAEDRFERMFNANPAPALIVRVSDLRYVRVNHGFMEMTGYKSRDLVGRTLYEFDVLEG